MYTSVNAAASSCVQEVRACIEQLAAVASEAGGEVFLLGAQLHHRSQHIGLSVHVLQVEDGLGIAIHARRLDLFDAVGELKQSV